MITFDIIIFIWISLIKLIKTNKNLIIVSVMKTKEKKN